MAGPQRGFFLGIEGIDAVGKRTHASILNSWLTSLGLSTTAMSFPDYGTVIGNEIRRFLSGAKQYPPQVRAMLYAANRWEKKHELEENLLKADITIVNRYTGSNLAYGVSNGLSLEWLANLEVGLPLPDLVLVLDAPPATLSSRRQLNKDTYEKNLDLQDKARRAYLKLAPEMGWKVIDAARGIQATSKEIRTAVSASLEEKGVVPKR